MPKIASFHPLRTKDRAAKWMVNIPAAYSDSGRRKRHFFSTKEAAQTFCDQITAKLENYGAQAHLLSPSQTEQAVQAFEKLLPFGVAVNTVVEEWIARRRQSQVSVSFEKLIHEFAHAGRRNRPRSQGYRQSILQVEKRLKSLHGRIASEVTPQDIESAVQGMTPSVRNYTLRILSCAFNLGATRGYVSENPARKIEQSDVQSQEIAVYTPEEVMKVIRAAELNDPNLVPFLAISFFAGIRRSEVLRMDWSQIQLAEDFIRLQRELPKHGKEGTFR